MTATSATIDLNTCQPGQMLVRRDGLKAEYVRLDEDGSGMHCVEVYWSDGVHSVLMYSASGVFFGGSVLTDIIEIIPQGEAV